MRRWPTEKVVNMIIEKFGEEVAEKFRGSYIPASYSCHLCTSDT